MSFGVQILDRKYSKYRKLDNIALGLLKEYSWIKLLQKMELNWQVPDMQRICIIQTKMKRNILGFWLFQYVLHLVFSWHIICFKW